MLLAPTLSNLYTLKTAVALSVIVNVIVSSLVESLETKIDLTIAVVAVGALYNVVTFVLVK